MARQQDKSVLLYSGVTAPCIRQQEAASLAANAYYAGDCVHIDDTGYLIISTGVYILGLAQADCTGVDYAEADVELIDFNALYTITAAGGSATARANIGETQDITFTPGEHVVASTSNNQIQLVGIYLGNDDTTNGGRYIVKFNAATVQPGT